MGSAERIGREIGTRVAVDANMPQKGTPHKRTRRRAQAGFTLIELTLVIMILGLLSTIGFGNVVRFAERAKRAGCVANQRHLHEASILYGIEQDPGTGNINASALWGVDLVQNKAAECPSSNNATNNDYDLLFIANELSLITCDVRGALHPYTP